MKTPVCLAGAVADGVTARVASTPIRSWMRQRSRSQPTPALSRRALLALGTAAVLVIACSGSEPTRVESDGSLRVLFVGNSHSRTNSLPQIVQALADSAGGRPIHIGEVIYGGVSLEDHWHARVALDSIATRRWDIVVLQQGPSSLDASRTHLITWSRHFASRIRAAGAEPALYQIWPEDSRRHVFDRVLESYRLAADSVNGELLPAGAAWQAAWQRDATLPLYAMDGAHASLIGTYLVALTIYAELLDQSPVGLPSRLTIGGGAAPHLDIAPAQAALLQAAADEVTRAP